MNATVTMELADYLKMQREIDAVNNARLDAEGKYQNLLDMIKMELDDECADDIEWLGCIGISTENHIKTFAEVIGYVRNEERERKAFDAFARKEADHKQDALAKVAEGSAT